MRKLLLILCLVPLVVSGQVWQQNNLEYGHQFKGLKALRALLFPLAETTAGQGRDTGAVYYRLADSSLYVYTGSQWRQVTGSGGSSYIFSNGLNEDAPGSPKLGGALIENTTITGGGLYQLNITGLAAGTFRASSATEEGTLSLATNNPTLSYAGYSNGKTASVSASTAGIVMQAQTSGASFSSIITHSDSISLRPHLGKIWVDTLAESSTDTTVNKPITYNLSTRRLEYLTGWPSSGSGATVLNNVGTGFDLAQQGTANVKRIAEGFGMIFDSTTTANTVILKVDSADVATVYSVDTAKANIRAEMSTEGITYGTVVQRLAIDTSTLAEGHQYYQTDQRMGKYEFSSEMGWRFIGAPEMYVVNDQFAFEAGAVGSQHTASVSGTGAVARFLTFNNARYDSLYNRGNGIWEIATGTTSTGFALIFTNSSNFGVLRNSRFYTETRIWIDTLSDATNSYLFRLGIKARGDLPNAANAVYFVYSDTTFSSAGTWATVTTDGSGATTMKNTAIIPTARTWVRLGIEWYSDIPTTTYRAKFYINDVLVGTHERISGVGDNITEVVEGGSHVTSSSIRKLAGATNRQIFFDHYNAINQHKQ